MNNKLTPKNSKESLEIVENSNISFFSVSQEFDDSYEYNTGEIDNSHLNDIKYKSDSLETIYNLFSKKNGIVSDIFEVKHEFIINSENSILVRGLDNIEFEFIKKPLNKNSGIYIINLEIKNIDKNLTRKQKHYLSNIFYNLKQHGFNIKYIDDNFSSLNQKDYFFGHNCNTGDVCTLISSFRDGLKEDDKKIKESILHLKNLVSIKNKDTKNSETLKKESIEINNILVEASILDIEKGINFAKKEIIATELKNIFDFKNSLENIILNRNRALEQNKISDEILQEIFKGQKNFIFDDKIIKQIQELQTLQTDIVLSGSFGILKGLVIQLANILKLIEKIDKINNYEKQVEILEQIINSSNNLFLDAEKTARKNKILGLLNPKNWFGKNKDLEISETKEQKEQREIEEFFNFALKILSYIRFLEQNDDENLETKLREKIKLDKKNYQDNDLIQKSFLNYIGYYCLSTRKYNPDFTKIGKDKIKEEDKEIFKKFSQEYTSLDIGSYIDVNYIEPFDLLYFKNYSDLEEIFDKYEEFKNLLFLKDYAFNYSKLTGDLQKVLYKKGEFYYDEKVDFEKFVKDFFYDLKQVFEENKKNTGSKLSYEIIEKNNNLKKELSEFNNIFDIKIGDNIFSIYVVNPIGDKENKIVTIGTKSENDISVLKQLINFAYIKNRENLQKAIKKEVNNILVMNFEEKDWNYNNKVQVANGLLLKKKKKKNNFDVINISIDKNRLQYTQRFNLIRGTLEIEQIGGYDRSLYHISASKKISEVGVKLTYEIMGIIGRALFDNVLGGEVLNNYIVNYLIYGLKPDKEEKNKVTYKKTGEKLIKKNYQYEKYLEWSKKNKT